MTGLLEQHVHEEEIAPKLLHQPILNAACIPRAIITAITEENLGRHGWSVWLRRESTRN
jgi:hypothetical protein